MAETPDRVPQLLDSLAAGDSSAAEELFPIVYEQLHRRAEMYMRRERSDHTLQPTALIHEAYLRLMPDEKETGNQDRFKNLEHFVATAAVVMRRILVNHAKAKKAQKRSGQRSMLQIDEISDAFDHRSVDLVELDEVLQQLKQIDPLQHQLVELRFFGGLTVEECAKLLSMSPRAVYYEWSYAKAWLRNQLEKS